MDILLKNKFLIIVVAALVLINGALLSSFWYFHELQGKGKPAKEKRVEINTIEFFRHELSFDKEQSDSLEKLFERYNSKVFAMKEEIRNMHNQINSRVLNNTSSEVIKSEFDSLGTKKAELDRVSYEFFIKLRSMCSNAQRQKFDELFRDIIRIINKPPQKNK